MEQLADLLRELIEKMDDVAGEMRQISSKLDQISSFNSIDDVVSKLDEVSSDITSKLDEVSSNITGPTMYNLEDIWKEVSRIE